MSHSFLLQRFSDYPSRNIKADHGEITSSLTNCLSQLGQPQPVCRLCAWLKQPEAMPKGPISKYHHHTEFQHMNFGGSQTLCPSHQFICSLRAPILVRCVKFFSPLVGSIHRRPGDLPKLTSTLSTSHSHWVWGIHSHKLEWFVFIHTIRLHFPSPVVLWLPDAFVRAVCEAGLLQWLPEKAKVKGNAY